MSSEEELPHCSLKLYLENNEDTVKNNSPIKIKDQKSILKKNNKRYDIRRKKREVAIGRINKHRQTTKRRGNVRKPKQNKNRMKSSNSSISSYERPKNKRYKNKKYLRKTSASSSRSEASDSACEYCGHRCCKQRLKYEKRRQIKKTPKKQNMRGRVARVPRRKNLRIPVVCASIQVGSRSLMLSPLCVSTNLSQIQASVKTEQYKVTPEMIVKALTDLTMWRQAVDVESILNFLIRNFPLNQNRDELLEDLTEKLRIAEIVEIVHQTAQGKWELNHALQKRKFSETHVTLFWEAYGDTLKPVARKREKIDQKPPEDDNRSTTNQKSDRIYDELFL